jgi:hypothetical protein
MLLYSSLAIEPESCGFGYPRLAWHFDTIFQSLGRLNLKSLSLQLLYSASARSCWIWSRMTCVNEGVGSASEGREFRASFYLQRAGIWERRRGQSGGDGKAAARWNWCNMDRFFSW